ncbi:S41 family peptidase [Terriglobus saanensis]|uniref:Carboxyl-terminal protease n=1 Tax=Terriglobus saanensis (strain ATCC BAA-1853 / DSM 23119 / SP1PR4) TaxID=401053 RepID=E8V4M6_TERSS|nr:S41 family peptidase [Terriglobus saanensis]ADV81430.1 carboxyl-terminal protease [Terriglobus saanensis SP1PR4]
MAFRTPRAVLSLTLFLSTCAVVGSLMNQKVSAQAATEESTLRDSLHQFTDVYSVIEQNYADPLNNEKVDKIIYDGAIPNMLHVLDPHSSFYDPKAYAQMREDQHGQYYGVGMSIQPQLIAGVQRIVVLAPFEGTPSYKAGIRPGDIISAVDGKTTDGMDSVAVSTALKGPKGTQVQVTMVREGAPKPLVFSLIRDSIPRPSVDLAFLIKPGVGYIHVGQFMETTSHEVGEALERFGPLNGLLIDMRSNPGGLVNEAVAMADKFLQRGQVVVSQKGRSYPDQVYRANRGTDSKPYPIVVLVNRNTASAAEIVSGALQDHDRALIVGETTFGKGLVQTVFQVADNTGLALTTFHYYTPSGRLIQRNYSNVSLYDYYYVRDGASKKDNANREVKLTDSGRTVYGGGGITPDEKIEAPKSNPFQNGMAQHYAFFNFSKHYLSNRSVTKDFQVDDAVMQEFKAFLKEQKIDYTDQDIAANLDWVKMSIKADLVTSQFGQIEGLKVRADWDPTINKALTYLPEAQALEEHTTAKPQVAKTASLRQ